MSHLLLDLLVNKSDEAESFGFSTARSLLQLDHVDLTKWLGGENIINDIHKEMFSIIC